MKNAVCIGHDEMGCIIVNREKQKEAMNRDIVADLRGYAIRWGPLSDARLAQAAADEIERLRSNAKEVRDFLNSDRGQDQVAGSARSAILARLNDETPA